MRVCPRCAAVAQVCDCLTRLSREEAARFADEVLQAARTAPDPGPWRLLEACWIAAVFTCLGAAGLIGAFALYHW